MTMIAYAFLNEIIIEKKISDPALILERLDQQLIYAFQYETDSVISLGMDISICAIQKNTSFPVEVTFAGAKQSIYLYRSESKTLEKFRGIRRSLTCKAQMDNLRNFTNHHFKAQRGDILYLTTDGLMDVPNPKRRNFGPLRFQNMLSEHAHFPINQQKELYLQVMADFQQDQDQRDDIGLMGFEFGDSFLI
jgi:Stage II sporulation protein E (SpoIIE)